MQSVGIRYVRYFDTTYARIGGLWEGRYRVHQKLKFAVRYHSRPRLYRPSYD